MAALVRIARDAPLLAAIVLLPATSSSEAHTSRTRLHDLISRYGNSCLFLRISSSNYLKATRMEKMAGA